MRREMSDGIRHGSSPNRVRCRVFGATRDQDRWCASAVPFSATNDARNEQERLYRSQYGLISIDNARSRAYPDTTGSASNMQAESSRVLNIARSAGTIICGQPGEMRTFVGQLNHLRLFFGIIPGPNGYSEKDVRCQVNGGNASRKDNTMDPIADGRTRCASTLSMEQSINREKRRRVRENTPNEGGQENTIAAMATNLSPNEEMNDVFGEEAEVVCSRSADEEASLECFDNTMDPVAGGRTRRGVAIANTIKLKQQTILVATSHRRMQQTVLGSTMLNKCFTQISFFFFNVERIPPVIMQLHNYFIAVRRQPGKNRSKTIG